MKKIVLLLLICLFIKNVNAQNDYQDLEFYQFGCKLLDSLKYNEAIYYFNKAIKSNPENTIYYYKRGQTYYKLKNYTSAKEDFLYCLKSINNEPIYYHLVGLCNDKIGLSNEAIVYYSKAIEINANDLDFYKSRASLYLRIDSLKLAINDYNYVLTFNSQDDNAYYNRGVANYKNKNIESACLDWENAQLLSNKNADEYITKYCRKGNSKKEVVANKDLVELPKFSNSSYQNLRQFIATQLRFPVSAATNCRQGTVILRFTVKYDGEINFIKVINSVASDLDEEAIRVIKLSNGLWKGGSTNGKPSDIELTFPITFQLKPDCSKGISHYIKKGLKHYERSEYKDAIICFSEVIKRDPYNKEIINKRIQARKMIKDTLGIKEDMILLDNNYFKSINYSTTESIKDTSFNIKIFYDSLWNICSQNNAKFFRQAKWNTKINFFEGDFNDYYLNGSIICNGKYINKKLEGEFNYFSKNGNQFIKGFFANNLPIKTWEFYFENGKISNKIEIISDNLNIKEVYDSLGNNMNTIGNFISTIRIPNYVGKYNVLNISYKNNKKHGKWTFFVNGELVIEESYKNSLFKTGIIYTESSPIEIGISYINTSLIIPSNISRTELLVFENDDVFNEYTFIRKE